MTNQPNQSFEEKLTEYWEDYKDTMEKKYADDYKGYHNSLTAISFINFIKTKIEGTR